MRVSIYIYIKNFFKFQNKLSFCLRFQSFVVFFGDDYRNVSFQIFVDILYVYFYMVKSVMGKIKGSKGQCGGTGRRERVGRIDYNLQNKQDLELCVLVIYVLICFFYREFGRYFCFREKGR